MSTPWNDAVASQFTALKYLERADRLQTDASPWTRDALAYAELREDFALDAVFLRRADTYAWMDPALSAVLQASETIPTDAPIQLEQIPGTGSGWYHFSPPLSLRTITDVTVPVAALLWGVVRAAGETEPSLVCSAYVQDKGEFIPSTKFWWKIGRSCDGLLEIATSRYDDAYGPGGYYHHAGFEDGVLLGKEVTMHAVSVLARFLLASFIWLEQDILVDAPAPVPRQQRKSVVREHKIEPSLKLVALRHVKYSGDHTPAVMSGTRQAWAYQWTVEGHWRQQPYGPGRLGRKTIYVNPYIKGPDDKPLKAKPQKVYVVMK